MLEIVGDPAEGREDKSTLCTLNVPVRLLGEEEVADAGEGLPDEEDLEWTRIGWAWPESVL